MNFIMDLIEVVVSLYNQKKFIKLVGAILTITIVLILGAFAVSTVFYIVYKFIGENLETIVIGGILFTAILYWISNKRQQRNVTMQAAQTPISVVPDESEKAMFESNYIIVRQCIFTVLCEIADSLGLTKPQMQSEIDSPGRIISKSNVTMYQFLALKKSEINLATIKGIMQTRITQKLAAQEFSGLSQVNYIFNGVGYPILCVDDCVDNGAYLSIDVAWFSDNYGNLLSLRKQAQLQNLQGRTVNLVDSDF